ncbi:MAG: hypothetical protein CVT92_10775 [Bacteroidetes bacterium HGW-Bacteroidetes-1]|jgi:hypothetical protein|nr:MAG: hypothetical protein CVT92_10775 [Bacteroidetes bacterium HGW-Bacteroidetes-1]
MEQHYGFFRSVLILIAIGIWIIVLQNAGLLPQIRPLKIQADQVLEIKGLVEVENTVFIKGQVDANLESINGYSKFYKDPRTGEYYVIPVTDPYE